MKSSSVEKAFADPQSLAVTAKVAAGLKDQLQKTPLQVEQRQQQLKRVLVDSDLFANNSARTTAPLSSISGSISGSISASASTLAPKNNDGSPVHSVVQVFDHNFGAGLDFLLTWTLWLQAKEDHQQLQGLNYVALCEQPLCLTDLQQLHQNWPQLETLSLQLQVQYPPAIKGFHQLDFGQVRLTIVQAESTLALEQIKSQFDVFLGGPESKPHKAYTPPWQRSSMGATAAGKVAIIGAGISGVASAYSLSRRGFDVTLIEQGPALASAASGNRQGMLYAKLPDNATIAGQFHQQGLQHTMALLKRSLNAEHWQACGLLQLATSAKQEAQMQGVMAREYPSSWLQWLNQAQAEKLAKQPLSAGGLYFPSSGWVSPTHWCEALYSQSNARLWLNTKVGSMVQIKPQTAHHGWQLRLSGKHAGDHTFDAIVIANANGANQLLPDQPLPLKSIRGQVSYVAAEASPALVVCGEGYVTPAQQGVFAVGASYNLHTDNDHLSGQDDLDNLARLTEVLPHHKELGLDSVMGGRVGFRAVTPDYLPMVGQLADEAKILDRFAKLRQDANYKFADNMPFLAGLYINAGHGSKGLISAPLSAEILASQMANQSLPVAQCVAWGLDPNRFIIRDLIRRKR